MMKFINMKFSSHTSRRLVAKETSYTPLQFEMNGNPITDDFLMSEKDAQSVCLSLLNTAICAMLLLQPLSPDMPFDS